MPAVPETGLGAVDTKISETQALLSSCLHSSVTNVPATDECNEVIETWGVREGLLRPSHFEYLLILTYRLHFLKHMEILSYKREVSQVSFVRINQSNSTDNTKLRESQFSASACTMRISTASPPLAAACLANCVFLKPMLTLVHIP